MKCMVCSALLAASAVMMWGREALADDSPPRCVAIDLFFRGGDEEERAVVDAARRFAAERGGVVIRGHDLDADQEAGGALAALAERVRFDATKTPVLFGCNRVVGGIRDGHAIERTLRDISSITLYTRPGCGRCAAAKAWLPTLLERCPGFRAESVDIASDAAGRARLEQILEHHHAGGVSVPVIHVCHSVVVGFDTAETTGRRIGELVDRWTISCPRPEPRPPPGDAVIDAVPELSEPAEPDASMPSYPDAPAVVAAPVVRLFDGRLDPQRLGMPLFTLAVGLVDGFNPCAMWVLLLLLSLLVSLRDRWRILAIAGTFVVVSGGAYFAFMAAWLNVFEWIGYLRPVQVVLGLTAVVIGTIHVKDFFAFKQGVSLSIPEAARPGLYERMRRIVTAENLPAAVAGAFTLAVLVNVVELLCTAGLPAVYTSVLSQQRVSIAGRYGYLLLYILAYMLDDALMVGTVVWSLSRLKLQETGGRWLKLASGSVILLLGLIMLFKPEWLA